MLNKCAHCGYESNTEVHEYQCGTGLIWECDNIEACQIRMVKNVKDKALKEANLLIDK